MELGIHVDICFNHTNNMNSEWGQKCRAFVTFLCCVHALFSQRDRISVCQVASTKMKRPVSSGLHNKQYIYWRNNIIQDKPIKTTSTISYDRPTISTMCCICGAYMEVCSLVFHWAWCKVLFFCVLPSFGES